jgi:hypothetical protein
VPGVATTTSEVTRNSTLTRVQSGRRESNPY